MSIIEMLVVTIILLVAAAVLTGRWLRRIREENERAWLEIQRQYVLHREEPF